IFGCLVPQDCRGDRAVWACDFCALGQLMQNIINWLLAMSILVAAVMFAYAGILLFTSAGNVTRVSKAKTIFLNVAIGFFLAIGGWLFIQTILSGLVNQKFFLTGGKWNSLECEASRTARQQQIDKDVNQWLRTSLPGVGRQTQAPQVTIGQSSVLACPPGWEYVSDYGQCINPNDRTQVEYAKVVGSTNFNAYSGDIASAIQGYYDTDTSAGPNGGYLACAWAVNNVLGLAGRDPIDQNSVGDMEVQLKGGRGEYVENIADAEAGNIIVWKGVNDQGRLVSHVGFCADKGCETAISNSSNGASFNNKSGSTFLGIEGRVYRVK
ncbi:MAG: pilin, partial [Patescibacteria group bacterium]